MQNSLQRSELTFGEQQEENAKSQNVQYVSNLTGIKQSTTGVTVTTAQEWKSYISKLTEGDANLVRGRAACGSLSDTGKLKEIRSV